MLIRATVWCRRRSRQARLGRARGLDPRPMEWAPRRRASMVLAVERKVGERGWACPPLSCWGPRDRPPIRLAAARVGGARHRGPGVKATATARRPPPRVGLASSTGSLATTRPGVAVGEGRWWGTLQLTLASCSSASGARGWCGRAAGREAGWPACVGGGPSPSLAAKGARGSLQRRRLLSNEGGRGRLWRGTKITPPSSAGCRQAGRRRQSLATAGRAGRPRVCAGRMARCTGRISGRSRASRLASARAPARAATRQTARRCAI